MPSLFNKYEPKDLNELLANENNKIILNGFLNQKEIPQSYLFVGDRGCVDCDTEFFNGFEWKKISEYDKADLVMQYNLQKKEAELVYPLNYIKNKQNKLFYIKSKYGVDQCLSLNHNVLYKNKKTQRYETSLFENIKNKHESLVMGFTGKFQTTFDYQIKSKLEISDILLRIQVMVNADGYFIKRGQQVCINLKKKRKIERAELLLKQSGLKYRKYEKKYNGYTAFFFVPFFRTKIFDKKYFKCSKIQLDIILDELKYWDFEFNGKKFSSNNKEDIDFLQYAYAVCGYRTTVRQDKRNKNINYILIISNNSFVGITKNVKILEYNTKDGFEYCFTVSSSYLILRRNFRIFITGNCGKSLTAKLISKQLNCQDNIQVLDCITDRGIDNIRKIIDNCQYRTLDNNPKSYIIEEAHQLPTLSQEGFLTCLQKPPKNSYFFFTTTEESKIVKTIISRSKRLIFEKISNRYLYPYLIDISIKENNEISKTVARNICNAVDGHIRDSLSLLEVVLQFKDESKQLEIIGKGIEEDKTIIDLCRLLLKSNSWNEISNILKQLQKENPESIRKIVISYFGKVLLDKADVKSAMIIEALQNPIYDFPILVMALFSVFKN